MRSSPPGRRVLGAVLIEGRMTKRDLGRAFALYEKGCEAGSAEVCGALGSLLLLAGRPSEHARAVKVLEKGCTSESGETRDGGEATIKIESGHA